MHNTLEIFKATHREIERENESDIFLAVVKFKTTNGNRCVWIRKDGIFIVSICGETFTDVAVINQK